jgi:AraC-like DNA-binding protein
VSLQAADEEFEKLNSQLLRDFVALVHDLGADPQALLDAAEVSVASFDGGCGSVTYRQVIVLLEAAARMLGCPDFGMRLASKQRGGSTFGPLGVVMRNSQTFGDALKFASEHSNAHSRAAKVWLTQASDDGDIFAGHELLLGNIPGRAQAIEQILLIGHFEAVEMTGGHARARRIHFRHEPVSPRDVYRRYFRCEVRFGEPADGIVFSPFDLACPVLRHSSRVQDVMSAYIEDNFPTERPPFHVEVRSLITRRLGLGSSSSGQVAGAMNLHVRTLRRRLKDEGTSFQEVKDEVRRELTLYYLSQTSLDIRSISEKLGFAEQSIFSRSCRRWFGRSPSALKAQRRDVTRGVLTTFKQNDCADSFNAAGREAGW